MRPDQVVDFNAQKVPKSLGEQLKQQEEIEDVDELVQKMIEQKTITKNRSWLARYKLRKLAVEKEIKKMIFYPEYRSKLIAK